MGIETKETIEHIYDTDLIAEAVYYIEQGFRNRSVDESVSREVVSRIVETADKVLSTVIKKRTTAEVDNKETEEEAREYFGDDFIKQFEDIRKRLSEQGMTLYIHGTDIEIAERAMENGFEAKQPSITSTAVIQQSYEDVPEYQEFSKFMNWPHKDYKGFVLVAAPNECRDRENPKPLWEYRPVPEGTELTDSTRQFVIRPEFIVGTLDATEKKITENPLYTNVHNYDGLLIDDFVARPVEIETAKEETEITEDIIEDIDSGTTVLRENDAEYQSEKIESEIQSLVDKIYEFYTPILLHKQSGGRIVEMDVDELTYLKNISAKKLDADKVYVLEAIERLKEIIPTLESRVIDDKRIDDFISDVRMSGVTSFTEKIKMLQIANVKGQDFEWGDEELTGGTDRDDEWN